MRQPDDLVLEILEPLLKALVTSPECLRVRRFEDESKIVYFVYTKCGEEGLLIGKGGTLATSVRNIIKAIANRREMKHVYLDIVNTKAEQF